MDSRLAAYMESIGAPRDSLDGWTIRTAQRGGADVAFVISRGPELHFVSIAEGGAMSRRNIIEAIAPILAEYGYVTTRTPHAECEHRLRFALGFSVTWQDENYSYWALTAMPYQKHKGSTSCQSPS